MAILRDVADPQAGIIMTAVDQPARPLGLTLIPAGIWSADDLETAFADMKKSGAEAFIETRSALTFNLGKQIADLALAARLPRAIRSRRRSRPGHW